MDPRISAIAASIAAAIPEAQVRLFGSRAKGTARPDSDVNLLITVLDHWLAERDRIRDHPGLSGRNPASWLIPMPFATSGRTS
jgi:predicted nucleotidyltransferase